MRNLCQKTASEHILASFQEATCHRRQNILVRNLWQWATYWCRDKNLLTERRWQPNYKKSRDEFRPMNRIILGDYIVNPQASTSQHRNGKWQSFRLRSQYLKVRPTQRRGYKARDQWGQIYQNEHYKEKGVGTVVDIYRDAKIKHKDCQIWFMPGTP